MPSENILYGEFEAVEVLPTGERRTLVKGRNQIMYHGANLIAKALSSTDYTMPVISDIYLAPPSTTDPLRGVLKSQYPPFKDSPTVSGRWADDAACELVHAAPNFSATPSTSPTGAQAVVCVGTFTSTNTSDRIYEFALTLNDDAVTPLAYWYEAGGVSWGIGTMLEVIWTIHLGVS